MKTWTVTMRIETEDEDEFSADDIRSAIYDAGGNAPFAFDITSVEEQQ